MGEGRRIGLRGWCCALALVGCSSGAGTGKAIPPEQADRDDAKAAAGDTGTASETGAPREDGRDAGVTPDAAQADTGGD